MSAIEKVLIKGRGRDEALMYRRRKYYRVKTCHSGKHEDSHAGFVFVQDKPDAYLSRTIDWLGRSANYDQKAKAKARKVLIRETLKNGNPVVVVTPAFFPSPENISKFIKSKSDNKK